MKSRFNTFIIFDDYNEEELFEIFEKMCKQDDYELAWEVVEKMKNIFVEKVNDDVKISLMEDLCAMYMRTWL